MRKVSLKLRAAMERKGIAPDKIDKIIQSISSFALYGFPESHAISFAILAYGSAYLKVHRAPEFYASLINNQPMGFYTPATIVKDAQRHGVNIKPVCVLQSDWHCTVVSDDRPSPQSSPWPGRGGREAPVRVGEAVRLGFCVVNGLRQEHAEELMRQRQDKRFESLDDLKRHVPFAKNELRALAELGALNCFAEHRRAAMWKVEETLHDDLLGSAGMLPAVRGILPRTRQSQDTSNHNELTIRVAEEPPGNMPDGASRMLALPTDAPLIPMTLPERVKADYETMNLTTGPHPMKLLRENLPNIWRAIDLVQARHGSTIQIAGNVICRQRPGTAKGFVFISLEDETGVSNAIVDPDLFERFRLVITEEAFLLIEGQVQNSDGVVLIKARDIKPLPATLARSDANAALIYDRFVGSESHDFH
jgi:error-prone DNA polymerase